MSRILIIIGFMLMTIKAYACPCGCGAVSPQVMYPGESMKIAVGYSRNTGYRDVLTNGNEVRAAGPDVIDTMTIGVGKAITNDLSVSVSLPIQSNRDPEEGTNTSLADPSLSIRYTALPQSFTEPHIPQVQVFATYKPTIGRGLEESERPKQMDVLATATQRLFPASIYGGEWKRSSLA